MNRVGWLAAAAVPGCIIFALGAAGSCSAAGSYHLLGLLAFFSTVVTVGAGVLVWVADKLKASVQTARLRAGMAGACVVSAMLLWIATALAFCDGVGDAAVVFLALLPFPLFAAVALYPRRPRAPENSARAP